MYSLNLTTPDSKIEFWTEKLPFITEWVDYRSERFFAVINFQRAKKYRLLMVNLYLSFEDAFIDKKLFKIVRYNVKNFEVLKEL